MSTKTSTRDKMVAEISARTTAELLGDLDYLYANSSADGFNIPETLVASTIIRVIEDREGLTDDEMDAQFTDMAETLTYADAIRRALAAR